MQLLLSSRPSLSQIVSPVSTFASLRVIGSRLAAVLYAVCMASVPEATNPLRYGRLNGGLASLPRCLARRVLQSVLLY